MNPDALNNPETLVDPLGLDPSDCRVNASGSVTCYGPDSTTVNGGAGGNCQMVTPGYVYCPGSSGGYWAMWGWNANCVTLGGCGPGSQSGVAGPASSPPAAKPPAPPPGLLSKFKNAVCSVLPEGRVMSINGSIGGIGGQNGSVSVVINYASGQVSGFATGGLQVGWNGLAQASVSVGFIYGALGRNNEGYSGTFTTGSGSGVLFGGYSSVSNGVTVAGVSAGANLAATPTGGLSVTSTSRPFQFGRVLGSLAITPLDIVLGIARQGMCQ